MLSWTCMDWVSLYSDAVELDELGTREVPSFVRRVCGRMPLGWTSRK